MTEKSLFSGRVKLVIRHSRPLVKVMVVVALVFSLAAMGILGWSIYDLRSQTRQMRNEAAALEFQNEELAEKNRNADSVQGLLDIAEEELGLVDPDIIIIDAE